MSNQIDFVPDYFGSVPIIRCDYEYVKEVEPMQSFNKVYLHNTFKYANNLEALLQFHIKRGWAGIGYHFAINSDGRIFYTRAINVQGARFW